MDFPFWIHPSIAGGQLIASIAILHVFISHFAVGMGLYVVMAEQKAVKNEDRELLNFVKTNSSLILFISAILGALTGVGIWFSIALVSPAGTGSLISIFVWGWASEWVFFVLEISALLMYYYTWDKISQKTHIFIGWLYFIGAFFSLVIIAGIIAFQLTPGTWLEDKTFWSGFFNASYLPQVVGRFGISLILAAVYSTLVLSFTKNERIKKTAGHFSGIFASAGFVLTFGGFYWWEISLPQNIQGLLSGGNVILTNFFRYASFTALGLAIVSLFFTFVIPKRINIVVAVILMVTGLYSFGYYEFARERARKPYIIMNYMYANGILTSEVSKLNKDGILSKTGWTELGKPDTKTGKGRAVFEAECVSCHEIKGYNALTPKMQGMGEQDIAFFLTMLDSNPLMPPFVGTETERKALAAYLNKEINGGS